MCSRAQYPPDLASVIADTSKGCLSTAAFELAAADATAELLRPHRVAFHSLVIFIDNEAARGIINSGSSMVASLRPLVHALFRPGEQLLAVRVGTDENNWSDRLSRGDIQSVLAEAEALGWSTSLSKVDDAGWRPLREAARVNALPQGDAPQP